MADSPRTELSAEFIISASALSILPPAFALAWIPALDYTVYVIGLGLFYVVARCLFKIGRGVSRKSWRTTEFKVYVAQIVCAMLGLWSGLPLRNVVAIFAFASMGFVAGRGYSKHIGKDVRTQLLIR